MLLFITQMYGYELPKTEITIEIFGKKIKITAQTYHAYESTFLEDYKKIIMNIQY